MGYLPKSQYKILQTAGEELVYKGTTKEYKGPYIETGDNKFFAGNDIRNTSIKLEKPKSPSESIHNTIKNQVYNKIKPSKYQFLSKTKSIITTKPVLTQKDYDNGKIIRYFSYRVNTYGSYREIDKETYKSIKTKKNKHDYHLYKAGKVDWMLEGDVRKNNYQLLQNKEKEFPGISLLFPVLNEYQKGKKSKYNIKGRVYPNGGKIAPNLPPAYGLSQKVSQFCQNCKFYNKEK